MQAVSDRLPRLGVFLDGDTVGDRRRQALQELPESGLWQFVAVGGHRPHPMTGDTSHMLFRLRYVGQTDA